jgi:hypothetical protein
MRRIVAVDAPGDEQVPRAVHRRDGEQRVGRARQVVGDVDQLRVVRACAGRLRIVEEGEVPERIRRADVEPEVVRAVGVRKPGCLEDLAGLLVDRRGVVGPERAVGRLGGEGAVVRRRGVVDPVEALVPLRAAVGTGADEVVVLEVDERSRARLRGVVRRARGAGS